MFARICHDLKMHKWCNCAFLMANNYVVMEWTYYIFVRCPDLTLLILFTHNPKRARPLYLRPFGALLLHRDGRTLHFTSNVLFGIIWWECYCKFVRMCLGGVAFDLNHFSYFSKGLDWLLNLECKKVIGKVLKSRLKYSTPIFIYLFASDM